MRNCRQQTVWNFRHMMVEGNSISELMWRLSGPLDKQHVNGAWEVHHQFHCFSSIFSGQLSGWLSSWAHHRLPNNFRKVRFKKELPDPHKACPYRPSPSLGFCRDFSELRTLPWVRVWCLTEIIIPRYGWLGSQYKARGNCHLRINWWRFCFVAVV